MTISPESLTDEQRQRVANDCASARELLTEYGWVAGDLRLTTGEMCAIGALYTARYVATNGRTDVEWLDVPDTAYAAMSLCHTGKAVEQAVLARGGEHRDDSAETIFTWNDHLDGPEELADLLHEVELKYRPDAMHSPAREV